MIDKKLIGKRIKIARINKNITQEILSEKIGLSANYFSKVERGLNSPSAEVLLRIVEILGLTLEDFGIYNNVNLNINKRRLINKITECSDITISHITPIIDAVIDSFSNATK